MRGSLSSMSDGELILVAAALLAAGIGASLLASRVRLPGLLLFLALGMAIGSDGLGWIDFNNYELARTIGVVALALILFEGGLTAGLRRDPARAAAVAVAGDLRHARHRCHLRLRGGVAVRPEHARGHAARRHHLLHRRRGHLRAAARVDAAPQARAHARGRGRLQRPGGRPARGGLHRVDPAAGLRRARHARCCSSPRWGSARSSD